MPTRSLAARHHACHASSLRTLVGGAKIEGTAFADADVPLETWHITLWRRPPARSWAQGGVLPNYRSSPAKPITSPDRITQKVSAPRRFPTGWPSTPSARKHGPDRTSWPAGRLAVGKGVYSGTQVDPRPHYRCNGTGACTERRNGSSPPTSPDPGDRLSPAMATRQDSSAGPVDGTRILHGTQVPTAEGRESWLACMARASGVWGMALQCRSAPRMLPGSALRVHYHDPRPPLENIDP
ncbi:hypothetical protein CGRA01v4_05157 [Colletotrichum graminicola]|nr:hypothetical protein CGRA01v4_05157 [Colletotrichum graminicola]